MRKLLHAVVYICLNFAENYLTLFKCSDHMTGKFEGVYLKELHCSMMFLNLDGF